MSVTTAKRKSIDMTQGHPLKVLMLFSIPMLIGAVFQQLYTTVDFWFMGHYVSSEAMAAVGATAAMIHFFQNVAIGITGALGIVISQYVGAKNSERVHTTSVNAILLTAATSLVMTIIALGLNHPILRLLHTPEDIISMSFTYSTIVLSGLICTLTYNMAAAVCRGLGDSVAPLVFLIISSLLNILLDYVFIHWLNMGVRGVAIATITSQGISALMTLTYLFIRYPVMRFSIKEIKADKEIVLRVLRMGVPMGLQSGCFTIGMMVMQGVINSFGTLVVEGYTAGVRVEELSWFSFCTYCQGITTYAGQNAGAKDIDRLKKGVRYSVFVLLIMCLSAAVLVWVFGKELAGIFVPGNEQVQQIAHGFLKVNSTFYVPMGWIMLYNYALKGMGEIKIPMISAFIELFCKIFFSVVLGKIFGYFGIWFAEPLGWVIGTVPPMVRYYSMKWQDGVMKLKT